MKQIEQPAALAEQEPVAWWHRKSNTFTSGNLVSNFAEWTPLYTSPPQRQPLTDEEMGKIINANWGVDVWEMVWEMARAVDARLQALRKKGLIEYSTALGWRLAA